MTWNNDSGFVWPDKRVSFRLGKATNDGVFMLLFFVLFLLFFFNCHSIQHEQEVATSGTMTVFTPRTLATTILNKMRAATTLSQTASVLFLLILLAVQNSQKKKKNKVYKPFKRGVWAKIRHHKRFDNIVFNANSTKTTSLRSIDKWSMLTPVLTDLSDSFISERTS